MSNIDPLFTPHDMTAELKLPHRIVMAPLTRSRATEDGMPTEIMKAYYAQRSSAAAIISEGIVISPQGAAYRRVPGLFSDRQVREWQEITEAVHTRGGKIIAQLWHVGRQSHSSVQPDGLPPWAPSAIPIENFEYYRKPTRHRFEVPRELTLDKIKEIVSDYAKAAEHAIAAGFDGVELHGANGYLIDQFLNSGSNARTDSYGGSIENRTRFLEEVVEAVSEKVGISRVGVRLSPSSNWMDTFDPNKAELYSYVVSKLNSLGVSFLHLVEPGVAGSRTTDRTEAEISHSVLAGLFDRTVVRTGNLTPDSARQLLKDGSADLVGFGRRFISNPDLPARIKHNKPLLDVDREGIYQGGAQGYITYPTLDDEQRWKDFLVQAEGEHESIKEKVTTLRKCNVVDLALSGELYQLVEAEKLLRAHTGDN